MKPIVCPNETSAYPIIGREAFLAALSDHFTIAELKQVELMYILAKYGHRGQFRDGGAVRYFEHPKAVAWILVHELGLFDLDLIIGALGHDGQEDTFLFDTVLVRKLFGRRLVRIISLLTKREGIDYVERLAKKGDWRTLFIKFADRLHNLRTLYACTLAKQRRVILETEDLYLPLAQVFKRRAPRQFWRQADALVGEIQAWCVYYHAHFSSEK